MSHCEVNMAWDPNLMGSTMLKSPNLYTMRLKTNPRARFSEICPWDQLYTLQHVQAGPFSISSQSTSWQLGVKSKNYEQNSRLTEHALSETMSQWCGAVCWHVNWCLLTPKLGGHRILLDNIDFDTDLILIETLYSTCIWLFLSVYVIGDRFWSPSSTTAYWVYINWTPQCKKVRNYKDSTLLRHFILTRLWWTSHRELSLFVAGIHFEILLMNKSVASDITGHL